MATLLEWINELSGNETIEAVVFGEMDWGDYRSDEWYKYNEMPKGVPIPLDVAMPWLTFEFDDGYGSPKCPAMVAYTTNSIISISKYDGSTRPFMIYRNPIDYDVNNLPTMPGGG